MNALVIARMTRQGALPHSRALPALLPDYSGTSYFLAPVLLAKIQAWKNGSVVFLYHLQGVRMESERLQDRRSNLSGLNRSSHFLGF